MLLTIYENTQKLQTIWKGEYVRLINQIKYWLVWVLAKYVDQHWIWWITRWKVQNEILSEFSVTARWKIESEAKVFRRASVWSKRHDALSWKLRALGADLEVVPTWEFRRLRIELSREEYELMLQWWLHVGQKYYAAGFEESIKDQLLHFVRASVTAE